MKTNRSEEKSAALSNLTNYIAQESYRASIIQAHTDEYNRIHRLFSEVEQTISEVLKKKLEYYEIQELSGLIIDHIVRELGQEKLFSDIYHYLPQPDHNDEVASLFNDITQSCIEIATRLYEKHINWNTNIHHRYPPSTLTQPLVLLPTLEYITEKDYEVSTQLNGEGGSVYAYTSPPFSISPTIETKPVCYRFREHHSQKQEIPNNSLYKRINRNECERPHVATMEQHSALCSLDFFDGGINSVRTIDQLQLTIDLSNPLSARELERIVFDLNARIRNIQWENSCNLMLLAEDLNQLEVAHNIPDIGKSSFTKYQDLTKADIDGISTLTHAKNAILGLMVWHQHFVIQDNENQNLPVVSYRRPKWNMHESFDQIIQQLKDSQPDKVLQHRRGYEPSTLKKGYEIICKEVQKQLIEQRSGRYQDRKLSLQRKEALLQSPDFNPDDLHPNDVSAVNTRIKKLNAKQFDGLLKQHSDGSIWILPIKR